MRLLTVFILTTALSTPLVARPLSFERRSPVLYQASLNNEPLTIHPDSLTIGGITLHFANASSASRIEGMGTSSPATYLSANSSRTFAQFPKLALRHLYPGVDVIFYGHGGHLEYDLAVSPGADLHRLRMIFDGARTVQVDGEGNLKIAALSGNLMQMLPRVFQADGRRVPASYVLLAKNQVGFRVGAHDTRLALTIDPELVFTQYFGGSATDSASAIASDAQGNIYIAGTSSSIDFPVSVGSQPRLKAPMAAISGGGQNITPIPVGSEPSVLAIGGSSDGGALYAVTPDAVYVSSDHGATWIQNAPLPKAALGGVNNISVDPVDPSRLFVATNSGLYFSSQGGENWYLYNSGLPTGGNGLLNVSSVLISPVNRATMYLVTSNPVGLYRSTNLGSNWMPLNPTYPNMPQPPAYEGYAATLDANGDLFIVDIYGTLLESTDQGDTWQEFAQQLYGTGLIVVDPANPSNIYVSDYQGIQMSGDGGNTFVTLVVRTTIAGGISQMALDSSSGTLYFGGSVGPVHAVSSAGGSVQTLLASMPNLHSLVTLAGQVYAGFDTPPMAYVIKWDPTGANILYSTFFGGTVQDVIKGLAVDAQGESTVAGYTYSPDFPVTTSFSSTPAGSGPAMGFIIRLSADGTHLVYSDLLGGSVYTLLQGLALDSSGAAYVTGETAAPDFALSSNAYQSAPPQAKCTRPSDGPFINTNTGAYGYVSKISADGSQLVYSTLITGSCGSLGEGLAVDAAGEAVVVGYTTSSDFPATAGSYQSAFPGDPNQVLPPNTLEAGFAAKISAAGDRLIACTYLGGSFETSANAAAVDAQGNIYLTGSTAKIIPGATPGAYQATSVDRCAYPISIGPSPPYGGANDAFVLKLDPKLSTAGFMTYLGGGCNDSGTGIALDAAGNAWINGATQSADFPLKSPFQAGGTSSQFVSEISADGSRLLFSSATDGIVLAIAPAGLVYLAGSGTSAGIPKHAQQFGGAGTAVEWSRIDPTMTPAVEIDNIQPVTPYPPSVLEPSELGVGVVPGELIQITGQNLGPSTLTKGSLDSTGRLPFTLAGTTVLFDNLPAPIISVDNTAVICFAPFEASQAANVTVEVNGQRSNAVRLGITAGPSIQILSVMNQDGTLNSADHPAMPGDVVVFYVSGMGETKPLSDDGLINAPPLPVPIAMVMANVAGAAVQPQFVGAAPGQIAGIVQINVQLPAMGNYSSNPISVGMNNASAPVYLSQ